MRASSGIPRLPGLTLTVIGNSRTGIPGIFPTARPVSGTRFASEKGPSRHHSCVELGLTSIAPSGVDLREGRTGQPHRMTLYRLAMKADEPQLSVPTLKVLVAFMSAPRDELSGADLARQARVGPGTLYPLLHRLERAGWLASRSETRGSVRTRPSARRRYYQITGLGVQKG